METIKQAIKNGATIIDVRTPEEYNGGHVIGSLNIPLGEISDRIDEIKKHTQPLIFCCASGGRSGQATRFFQQQGVDCLNGGSWFDVQMISL